MDEKSMDEKTINQIIPQIFERKKTNADNSTITSKLQQSMSQISSLATQSLIQESESLDKIIDMIENVDKVVKGSSSQNLKRMHEVCKSTNAILDIWIEIQSQATYVNNMMNNTKYIEYLKLKQSGKEIIEEETKEIEQLREEIAKLKEEKQKAANVNMSNPNISKRNRFGYNPNRKGSRIAKSTTANTRRIFR